LLGEVAAEKRLDGAGRGVDGSESESDDDETEAHDVEVEHFAQPGGEGSLPT
jgi:hypothetical protein